MHVSSLQKPSFCKHYTLIPINDDPILQMALHGGHQHVLLQRSTLPDQGFDVIAMRHAHDILLDDRTLIQIHRGVVRCSANELNATFMSSVIRHLSHKSWQERMMNVDYPIAKCVAEGRC